MSTRIQTETVVTRPHEARLTDAPNDSGRSAVPQKLLSGTVGATQLGHVTPTNSIQLVEVWVLNAMNLLYTRKEASQFIVIP